MATFKVGDRVRIVGNHYHPQIVGKTATIFRGGWCEPEHWALDVDGIGKSGKDIDGWLCILSAFPYELRPLLDESADEWAADKVKQVTKPTYLEPERVKERA